MKKMIPVYLLQLAMIGAFVFVSIRLLKEVQALRTDLAAIAATKATLDSE